LEEEEMKCLNCGSSKYIAKKIDYQYIESGLSNMRLKGVTEFRCQDCDETEVVIPQIAKLHEFLACSLSEKQTPLLPQEFRFLRKHLGYSSEDFSKKIGVTKFTVSRWENAKQKIEPAAERLLRLMIATSRPVERYPEEVFPSEPHDNRPLKLSLQLKRSQWVSQ
jgi:putative transcriptional regulator